MSPRPTDIVRGMTRVVREIWLFPVKIYRKYISRLKGTSSCRFTPTCSGYALEAVREWGIIMGTALAVWRVLRCNPFGKYGYDPVPVPPWKKNKTTEEVIKHSINTNLEKESNDRSF